MSTNVSVLPTRLDRLATEVADLLQEDKIAAETEKDAKAVRKMLPWEVGARLAEARAMFPSDEQYGQWIVSLIKSKMIDTKSSPATLNRFKNLSINFGHLRPEIETAKGCGLTALYNLNQWAEQIKLRSSITLPMVKERLAEEKSAPKEKKVSWLNAAADAGLIKANANSATRKKLQAELLEIEPSLVFDGPEKNQEDICTAIVLLKDLKNPGQAEEEVAQAEQEFLENSKAKNPVKSLEQVKNQLFRVYDMDLHKRVNEIVAQKEAELKEGVEAEREVMRDHYKVQLERLKDETRYLEKRAQGLNTREKKVDFFMTRDELSLVLGCLHPDKLHGVDDAQRERYAKAFGVMKRLKEVYP